MGQAIRKRIVKDVSDIYRWLDAEITAAPQPADCSACGQCCDFDSFGHKLFVTSPELLHFSTVHSQLKKMAGGVCPYNSDGKCKAYESRFAGCRIFACRGNDDFQSRLSEAAVLRFKELCLKYELPYTYTDLASALNRPAADSGR